MQRKVRAIFMVLVMVVLSVASSYAPIPVAKAAEKIQINIHYHRYAGDYEGWNIWSWPNGGEGATYEFSAEDDFGKLASYAFEIEDGTTQIGFIVRHSTDSNAWNRKDTDVDRFIDVTKAKDGILDIYVVQDDVNFGYGEEDMSLEAKILEASVEDSTTINFKVSSVFDSTAADAAATLTVKDLDGNLYAISKVSSEEGEKATSAVITMKEELDLFKKYTLAFEGYGEMPITNTKLFSTKEFEEAFYYAGDDLGAVWTKEETSFRVWAPTASNVVLNLYEKGSGGKPFESIPMTQDVKGTWIAKKTGDLNGTYYTYSVTVNEVMQEAVDPYARTAGINGDRGMVIDLDATNPQGFNDSVKPAMVNSTDAIIYELHVRDFSIDANSGMKNKGKYLAFTETGTTTPSGEKTGVDYLVDLGITHLHLLPVFDYASVDEATPVKNQFNWGYDPKNYNVPEGSYSTDPHKGEVRVNEFKQMVQSLHKNDIRVIMDVVYNHTFSNDSNLNRIVPGYYYRMNDNGTFSNASGCGNETASERAMMRKYIVDSVVYWATEYQVDGFRFDLMGIHDIETMNAVREALNKIDPTIIVYGEGWTGGASPLPESERAMKANTPSLHTGIAAFSDDLRDGIKGSVFDAMDTGFATGKALMEDTIKFGIVASTNHGQVDYSKVNYSKAPWAMEPTQTITYVSAHDNNTLWDKIAISKANDSLEDRIKMNLLSGAIVLTSQGTPFFQAGEEILRSKPSDTGTGFVENSYMSSDAVNSIKWETVSTNKEVYNYYKGLIAFRKAHSALRMTKTADIQANLTFMDGLDANVVGYTIHNSPNGETAEAICVIFNANKTSSTVALPEGNWNVYVKGNQAGNTVLESVDRGSVVIDPISALVLVKEDKPVTTPTKSVENEKEDTTPASSEVTADEEGDDNNNTVLYVIIGAIAVIAAVSVGLIAKRRKKGN